jgi:hypothetical protein
MRRLTRPKGPGGLSLGLRHPGQSVLSFLWSVYHSAAEGMPNKMKFAVEDRQTQAQPSALCWAIACIKQLTHQLVCSGLGRKPGPQQGSTQPMDTEMQPRGRRRGGGEQSHRCCRILIGGNSSHRKHFGRARHLAGAHSVFGTRLPCAVVLGVQGSHGSQGPASRQPRNLSQSICRSVFYTPKVQRQD